MRAREQGGERARRLRCALVLLAIFAAQGVMRLNCDNLILDDWTFFAALEETSLPRFLLSRWHTWSSRLLIEGTLCLTTHSIWAWRILDSAAETLTAWALCRLIGAHRRADMLALSGLLVTAIPFALLRSTGWQATSVNYYWPLACALAALIPLSDALRGEHTGRACAAASLLLALFAANQEQMAAALFGATAVLGGFVQARERRARPLLLALLAIAAAELLMHLLCPGNALRSAQSVAIVNLRDYAQFSLIDKLSVGLSSTGAILFFGNNPVLIACAGCVLCAAAARRRSLPALLVCAAPLAMAALCRAAWRMGETGPLAPLAAYGAFVLQLGPERILLPGRMAAMALLAVALGLCLLGVYLALGHRPAAACGAFALALGFAARMAVSLSPTVIESGERTMLPLYGAMMLAALLCLRDCRGDGSRRWPVAAAFALCTLLAALNLAGSFALAA